MKHILMLATGGTIASKESGRGLSPAITTEEILSYVPSLGSLCRVEAVQLMNLDSTNVGPAHWLEMASAIREVTLCIRRDPVHSMLVTFLSLAICPHSAISSLLKPTLA